MNKLENYIPILRTKSGELKGIKNLTEKALNRITPLFDFHRPKDSKNLQKQIDDVIDKLKFWPEGKSLIYDCALFDLDWRMNDGLTHPVKYVANKLMEKNISFIPTIGLDRDSPYVE